jgi:hypothetical protein
MFTSLMMIDLTSLIPKQHVLWLPLPMKPYKIVCFTSRYRALAARINEVSEGIAEMIR